MAPSVAALRWVPGPLASSSSRVNDLIGNLIDTARDSADLHQEHVDTDRTLDPSLTLLEQQLTRVERNFSYLVRKMKNLVHHEAEETTEDELLRLRTAVLHIVSRIGDVDPKGFRRDDSDSDRTV